MGQQIKATKNSQGRVALVLAGLFLLALLPRIIGVDYGYFHGDERIGEAGKVLTGQLVPGQHFYPPLINYLNAAGFLVLYGLGWVAGIWVDTADFRSVFFSDPTIFYITARILTAVLGALAAPMFYLIARTLGLPVRDAILAGLIGALLPLAVFMAHIAKGDAALGTATILAAALFLARHQQQNTTWLDVGLGVSVALALSFKHSFVFILAPLFLCHTGLLFGRLGVREALVALAKGFAALLILWPILNIGILLDLQNFIAFQKIQAVMSLRAEAGVTTSLKLMLDRAMDLPTGVTPVAVGLALLFPIYLLTSLCRLKSRMPLFLLWLSTLVSFAIMLPLVGGRQPEHLWLPQFSVMFLFAVLVIADLFRADKRAAKLAGLALAGMVVAPALIGISRITNEALAPPLRAEISDMVAEDFATKRVFTTAILDLPQARAARRWEVDRLNRLGQKYDVEIPAEAPEREQLRASGQGIYFINAPTAMFGLENASDEDLKGKVRAYAWPLQEEEWRLGFWLGQNVSIFIVSDVPYFLRETPSAVLRGFYKEITTKCALVREFQARKPLFLERDISVFDCKSVQE